VSPPAELAGLTRRLLSLLYEIPLLAAVLIAGSLPLPALSPGAQDIAARPLTQLYLVALAGLYFVWQWRRGGQTLSMRTWRIGLVARDGGPLGVRQAIYRYILALAGTLLLGAGFLWALADREGQFLHDRLAGTRIINC